jgi:hypothetical protein
LFEQFGKRFYPGFINTGVGKEDILTTPNVFALLSPKSAFQREGGGNHTQSLCYKT